VTFCHYDIMTLCNAGYATDERVEIRLDVTAALIPRNP